MAEHMQDVMDTDEHRREQLLWAHEVAALLRVSRNRAYHLMASGEIPSIRIGRSVRVRPRALNDWIAEQERASREIAV